MAVVRLGWLRRFGSLARDPSGRTATRGARYPRISVLCTTNLGVLRAHRSSAWSSATLGQAQDPDLDAGSGTPTFPNAGPGHGVHRHVRRDLTRQLSVGDVDELTLLVRRSASCTAAEGVPGLLESAIFARTFQPNFRRSRRRS